MANVINRTTLEFKPSVNTPEYPVALWIHSPDMSAVDSVPRRYWKISGDLVLEMDASEKAVVDAAGLAVRNAEVRGRLDAATDIHSELSGIRWDILTSGLVITFELDTYDDDVYTVVADGSDTTYVQSMLVKDSVVDDYLMVIAEKTTGAYGDLPAAQNLVDVLGEWSVVANGTTLVEVT